MPDSPPNKFDILHAQLGDKNSLPPDSPTLSSPFAGMRQPIELSPDVAISPEIPQESFVNHEKYIVSPKLLNYIREQIAGGKKIRALEFDLEYATSEQKVREIIEEFSLPKEEKQKMLGFVEEDKSSSHQKENGEKNQEKKEEKVTESKDDTNTLTPNENFEAPETAGAHGTRARRIKAKNLADNHGVVVEGHGVMTQLERGIQDKTSKIWEESPEKNTISQRLLGGDFDFGKKEEAVLSTAPPVETPQGDEVVAPEGTLTPQETEQIPEEKINGPLAAEEASAPIPEATIAPEPEAVAPAPESLPGVTKIPFDDKEIIVEVKKTDGSDGDVITVSLDGHEIANGTMTKKGPFVKLDPKFKSGMFFADTPQEKAFKKAWDVIRTLRK